MGSSSPVIFVNGEIILAFVIMRCHLKNKDFTYSFIEGICGKCFLLLWFIKIIHQVKKLTPAMPIPVQPWCRSSATLSVSRERRTTARTGTPGPATSSCPPGVRPSRSSFTGQSLPALCSWDPVTGPTSPPWKALAPRHCPMLCRQGWWSVTQSSAVMTHLG